MEAAILLIVSVAAATQQGLLLCDDPGSCEADRAFIAGIGGGGPGGFTVLDFAGSWSVGAIPDNLAAYDAFRVAREELAAAVGQGRWGPAMAAADEAVAALQLWRGPVPNHELVELWFLRGVAGLARGTDDSASYSFRQAAAMADHLEVVVPEAPPKARLRWAEERRIVATSGRGTLQIEGGPPGTRFEVDGRPVDAGPVELYPGNHRVTAVTPGAIRTWKVDVPILAGRTSAVRASFSEEDDREWVQARLHAAMDTLEAPDSVKDLLAAWCRDYGVREVRLMRVEGVREAWTGPEVALGPADPARSAASAGEARNLGDGVPATFEAHVRSLAEAPEEAHVTELHRVRLAWFDPLTRRFSAEPVVTEPMEVPPERLQVGVRVGAMGMATRLHVVGDVHLAVPVGPVRVEAELGLSRADEAYNLYAEWVDPLLWHLAGGVTWGPDWRVSPRVGGGVSVHAPYAVAPEIRVGAEAGLPHRWHAEAWGRAGWTLAADGGLVGAAGVGVTRGF